MSIFEDYLRILVKCYSIEIENNSFLLFIQKYSIFKRYYNFDSGEFNHEQFLYQILNDGTVNLNDLCYIDKKGRKNAFAYVWSLIEMKNSYVHIAYYLNIVLQRFKKDNFFVEELGFLLSEPHNLKDIGNEEYLNVQGIIIDILAFTYPEELKNVLKKYKFDMITSCCSYQGSNEPDYTLDRKYLQFKQYLKYLKHKSVFLKEAFPCVIDYGL